MKKMGNKAKVVIIVICVLLFLCVAVIGSLYVMQRIGKSSLTSLEDVEITAPEEILNEVNLEDAGKTVTYNGKKYQKKEDLISILCMGIDRKTILEEEGLTGENGQADTIFLAVLDESDGSMKLINISRDSMVDVDIYNVKNEYVETSKMQLCLSYAYGDGKETSCENTMKSVSRLLYGIPINAYAAIDLTAISVLNDAVGGVEVEVLQDLTKKDRELVLGERVLLQGKQAEIYVRSRDISSGVDSNNARMARQKQYLTNFINKALIATKEDITVPLTLYQEASSYMVTDISASEVTYLAKLVLQGGFNDQDMINVSGEVRAGEQFAEYYVDETALYEIILSVFYEEI